MTAAPPPTFLDYQPVPLAFGTSGLRGLVEDITDLEAYINIKGALRSLAERDRAANLGAASSVVLAGDLRPSTERILGAAARAIADSNCRVEYAGRIPSPALLLHAVATSRPGVMVTGSHIPFDRNGIKVNQHAGEILKSDERGILERVAEVRAEEYGRTAAESLFDGAGRLKQPCALPPVDPAAEERYVRRYLDAFAPGSLAGLRLVVYQHSAVGRDLLPHILRALGAEVIPIGRSDTFIPIDTENITEAELDRLEGFVREVEGREGAVFALVSTDGDSDRPLVTAVAAAASSPPTARRVRFLPGDLLGLITAEHLGADAVVVPISTNDAVDRRMKERGVMLRKCKIGSPHVIAGLQSLGDASTSEFEATNNAQKSETYRRIMGWEANGGFLLGSDIELGGRSLSALSTRDAVLPILVNLQAAAAARSTLGELWDGLPARHGRAGLLDDFPVAVSQAILAHLVPPGDLVEVEFDDPERVLDRSVSGGKMSIVPNSAAVAWRRSRATLNHYFTRSLRFGNIVRINVLDGVRVYFEGGDIVHLRPSGNAPQMRAYANSGTQERADQIVALTLREPDGVVRQMESELVP